MAEFINLEDYDASIHKEILDALVRRDKAVIEICEDRAIAEMRGYLAVRYDCEKIFSASGKGRNDLVLMMALDITIYHIFSMHNPQSMSQIRVDRYNRAMKWLEGVRSGDIVVDGLPGLPQQVKHTTSPYQIRSNKKRKNNF